MRLKSKDETRHHLIEEIKQNQVMNKTHKKVWRILNYIENLVILVSKVTGYIPIFALASLVGIPIGIMSYAIKLKICAKVKVSN